MKFSHLGFVDTVGQRITGADHDLSLLAVSQYQAMSCCNPIQKLLLVRSKPESSTWSYLRYLIRGLAFDRF
jgi:hypothetical protein